ncbi:MAG: crossover junction endodeoxyribonuclease RuvC [candidate division Zixibacteria bacterium CG_4_9_14_3_um_filter_46_8]|nr:MAG: crossover junction endodeoxyribonuclease RuvC [candidate division Zixibacteria bacterium CG_4_9_14_3_um_filter_46_8]
MSISRESNLVIGIDPGTNITGYALVRTAGDCPILVEAGVIRPGNKPLPERLNLLFEELNSILNDFKPSRMAVEELYSHYKHPQTSIIMGHARGVILMTAARAGMEVFSYPSTEIKKIITGDGRASKEKVRRMIGHILKLELESKYFDVSDALGVAITDLTQSRNRPELHSYLSTAQVSR